MELFYQFVKSGNKSFMSVPIYVKFTRNCNKNVRTSFQEIYRTTTCCFSRLRLKVFHVELYPKRFNEFTIIFSIVQVSRFDFSFMTCQWKQLCFPHGNADGYFISVCETTLT